MLTKTANYSIVMLGLVPSICIRSILDRQQILGTGPRMTPGKSEIWQQTACMCEPSFLRGIEALVGRSGLEQ
ncbi:hypothetical protein ELI02_20435 [Rhizobium leguminosarum]|nr:hypothetical protein ELI06_21860 [Rhizobium leguminosarum]TAX57891.1 hypothetical protein ELI01_22880 [Rhizobium leguminosarum]TAX62232.1 hypothetical protein ELI02_20435 [Rhizobium leguminosarum]TAY03761.1 hypothetical protein ELH95_22945 [Rhizobium leguminosarum]